MTLHFRDLSQIPADTAELGQKLLNKDNPYRLIGERVANLIRDEDFRDLFSPIGGPAISPAILSLVTIFQMMEKLPDRLAARAVALRIDWKYALHLPLDYPGFDPTNLEHFRQRLVAHQAEYLVFDRLLAKLVEMGLVRQRGKQRTDSSHVLGLVARLSRLEMVWETLRLSLEAVRQRDERWLERVVPEAFLQRYLVKRSEYRLTDQQVAAELRQAGADGLWWLQQLATGPAEWQQLAETQTLRTVWEQQFSWDDDGDYHGPRTKLEAHGLVISPHEPEARYRQKRDMAWMGYMVQVTESAEAKGDPNFITDVGLTDALADDRAALPEIHARLAERDLTPAQQMVDQNYMSGFSLVDSRRRGVELIGEFQAQSGPEGFKLDDFQVDLLNGQATCPAGQTTHKMHRRVKAEGVEYQFLFGQACTDCGFRHQCTQAKRGRSVNYEAHHLAVQQRRAEMQTNEFKQLMKRRPAIEGTISQFMRQGGRAARYRGLARVNLQMVFQAIAVNVRRLCSYWAAGKQPSWATE